MKLLPPGVTLLLLGPVLGELVSRHQTPFEFLNPLAFVVLPLPYGFGAIICRKLRVRWGNGMDRDDLNKLALLTGMWNILLPLIVSH